MTMKPEPLISICFDDGRETAFKIGAPILEKFGARGTFFPITSMIDSENEHGKYANWDTIKWAARSGHEIGSHTHSHSKNILDWKAHTQQADILRSMRDLRAHNITPATLAYPFGYHDDQLCSVVRRLNFTAARTIFPGINRPGIGDPMLLFSLMVEQKHSMADIKKYLEELQDIGGWLIFTFHHVDEKTFISTSPELLEEIIETIARKEIKIVTMQEGADRYKKK